MPIFYFDIETDTSFIRDDEGRWFRNAEDAEIEAGEAVTAIIWEANVNSVTITVRDSAGHTVGQASASLQKERPNRRSSFKLNPSVAVRCRLCIKAHAYMYRPPSCQTNALPRLHRPRRSWRS
jgi:hypothetical protein